MNKRLKMLCLTGVLVIGAVLSLSIVTNDAQTAWASAPLLAPANDMKGGGTAVLLPDGRIFDLTWGGWRAGISSPIPAKDVAIVLDSSRLVAKDGTGWVRGRDGSWSSFKLPAK